MVGLRRAKTVLLVLVVAILNTIANGAPLDPGPKGSGAAAPTGPAGSGGALDVKAAGAKGDGTTDDTAVRTKSDITHIHRFILSYFIY